MKTPTLRTAACFFSLVAIIAMGVPLAPARAADLFGISIPSAISGITAPSDSGPSVSVPAVTVPSERIVPTLATPAATVTADPTVNDAPQKSSSATKTSQEPALSVTPSSESAPAANQEATSTATSTAYMGAAPIINSTDGQPANIQYNATEETTKDLYGQDTMLPLNETLALLCLSLALFVTGIVCIRRDTIPMGAYALSPGFSNRSIAR